MTANSLEWRNSPVTPLSTLVPFLSFSPRFSKQIEICGTMLLNNLMWAAL